MRSPLLELAVRAQARRLRALARRRPLATGMLALAWLAGPPSAWLLGARLGHVLAPALAERAVARALVVGAGVTGASLGAVFAFALPGRLALGGQIAAAPVPPRTLVVATALPVLGGAAALVAPVAVALLVPLVAAAPGRAAPLVLLALTATIAAGATAAEAALRVARRGSAGIAVASLAAALVTASLAVETGAGGLAGSSSSGLALAGAAAVSVAVCVEAWLRLAAGRPDPTARRRLRIPMPVPCRLVVCAAAAALLRRPAELRLALVAAAGFGLLGLVVGVVGGAPPDVALLLGGGSCAVTVSLVPLSARGRIDAGAWVWRAGTRLSVALAWATASLVLVAAALAPVQIGATLGGAGPAASAQVFVFAGLAWAAALIAGAILPRRAEGPVDDALSLAAFTAVAVGIAAVGAVSGPRLGTVGVPDAAAVGVLLGGAAIVGVTMLGASREHT